MSVRFHSMLVVRDESDVIEATLDHLLSWSSAVYVHDTGSADDTWEKVLERAARDERVVPYRSEAVPYKRGVRSVLFNAFRDRMQPGDWVGRVDADEVYDVPPPEFVATRLRRHESLVHYQLFQFRFTRSDLAAWENGDRRPFAERLRRYEVVTYSEPRLFRYRAGLRWPADAWRPRHQGVTAASRIPVRHYQYRSPEQMECRWASRTAAVAQTPPEDLRSVRHWRAESWRDWVLDDDTPGLHTWAPGERLEDPGFTGHLPRRVDRVRERVLARG